MSFKATLEIRPAGVFLDGELVTPDIFKEIIDRLGIGAGYTLHAYGTVQSKYFSSTTGLFFNLDVAKEHALTILKNIIQQKFPGSWTIETDYVDQANGLFRATQYDDVVMVRVTKINVGDTNVL